MENRNGFVICDGNMTTIMMHKEVCGCSNYESFAIDISDYSSARKIKEDKVDLNCFLCFDQDKWIALNKYSKVEVNLPCTCGC